MTTAPPTSRNTTTRFNESALANYTSNVRNINVRRLLQQDTTVGQCLTGTFSSARGGGPCGGCPPFASTQYPWNGITDSGACACLPGFRSVRGGGGGLLSCVACPTTAFSLSPMSDDTVCLACPAGTDSVASQVYHSAPAAVSYCS